MIPREWEEYQIEDNDTILSKLIKEEIVNYECLRGKTGSKESSKKQFLYTLYFAIVMFLYIFMPNEIRLLVIGFAVTALLVFFYYSICGLHYCGVQAIMVMFGFPVMIYAMFAQIPHNITAIVGAVFASILYLILMLYERILGRVHLATSVAKANPTRKLSEIVAEDSYILGEEKPLGSSKLLTASLMVVAFVCVAVTIFSA